MRKLHIVGILLVSLLFTAGTIDLNNLFDYEGLPFPTYLRFDNTPSNNPITNEGATLGRVLFYDKAMSLNHTVSCASCHQQAFAFGDTARQSIGFDGDVTGRHSMRLINMRYAQDERAFWNERAGTIEEQTTQPIQDHAEMGFSGSGSQPTLDSLISRIADLERYRILFPLVFGDSTITETRLQLALSQFIRSIQSFDSKFDEGLVETGNVAATFSNFTTAENNGKRLFLQGAQAGGCQNCHRAPAFDIDPEVHNNGVAGNLTNPSELDLSNVRSPTLRDLVGIDGQPNGPIMHDGSLSTLLDVINHYDSIPSNIGLDSRLRGQNQQDRVIGYTQMQKQNLIAFLETLTGNNVYVEPAYSDPFDTDGSIAIVSGTSTVASASNLRFTAYPNPTVETIHLSLGSETFQVRLYSQTGELVLEQVVNGPAAELDVKSLAAGAYMLEVNSMKSLQFGRSWVIKR
ncbi:MAG: cytochrome c peroxidase [Saprospiraceae bacterium]